MFMMPRLISTMVSAALIVGNLVLFLPSDYTFGQLVPRPVKIEQVEMTVNSADDGSIAISINLESLRVRDLGVQAKAHSPVNSERRPREALIDVGKVSFWLRDRHTHESIRMAEAELAYFSSNGSQKAVVTILPSEVEKPHEEYEVFAVLYADPPFGAGESSEFDWRTGTNILHPNAIWVLNPFQTSPVRVP